MEVASNQDQATAPQQAEGSNSSAPKKPRRAYRACVFCRSRKLKCELGDPEAPSEPPCARCRRASRHCELSTAKPPTERGAARKARDRSASNALAPPTLPPPSQAQPSYAAPPPQAPVAGPSNYHHDAFQQPGYSPGHPQIPQLANGGGGGASSKISPAQVSGGGSSPDGDEEEGGQGLGENEDVLVSGNLHNPGDAFRLLISASALRAEHPSPPFVPTLSADECWARWPPIAKGLVSKDETRTLLLFFETEMSSLYPLLVRQIFDPSHLPELTSSESLLLGAMVVISARHSHLLRGRADVIHERVAAWIRQQLVTLLDGTPRLRHISTVEALLLLSEWPPLPAKDVDEDLVQPAAQNEEEKAISAFLQPSMQYDAMSWSMIGFACRLAQELGLHSDSLYPLEKNQPHTWHQDRNLRTWLYTYNADHHCSIRLGRNTVLQNYLTSAWWEQITSMSSKAASAGSGTVYSEEAMSQGFLAALMGTIQERLYSEKEITRQILKTGHWESFLRSLEQELKVVRRGAQKILEQETISSTLLHIEISYIHLYGNAIALRALQERLKRRMKEPLSIYAAPSLLNLAEGPWCIDALAAAQLTLHLTISVLEPKGYLRICPSRIFQRILFAAVFLFKALAVGVVEHGQSSLLGLLSQVINALHRCSIDNAHLAGGFGTLLGRIQAQCRPTLLSEPRRPSTSHPGQQEAPSLYPLSTPASAQHPSSLGYDAATPSASMFTGHPDGGVHNPEMEGLFAGVETFEMPWLWEPSSASMEAGQQQDLLFQALWSSDMTMPNANLNLLGTLVGDGF